MAEQDNTKQNDAAQNNDDPHTGDGSSYIDADPGYADKAAEDYNYKRRNKSNMSDQNYLKQNYGNQNYPNPNYGNQNYSNQNYGNQNYPNQNYGNQNYPNQNYGNLNYPNQNYVYQNYPNQNYVYQNYPNQNYGGNVQRGGFQGYNPVYGQGNYQVNRRANMAPYGMGGQNAVYPPYAGNGRPYMGNYANNYNDDDYDDYDDYNDDYDEYNYPRPYGYGYGYGPYCLRPPGMRRNRMYRQGYGPYNGPPGMGGNWMAPQYFQGQPYFDGYGPGPVGMGPWGRMRNWFSYNPVTNWVRSPRGSNFLRGLGIATAGLVLAPAVVKTIRPLAVQAVHGVMSIVGEVKGVVSDAREELEDIFADAKWENLSDREEKIQEG